MDELNCPKNIAKEYFCILNDFIEKCKKNGYDFRVLEYDLVDIDGEFFYEEDLKESKLTKQSDENTMICIQCDSTDFREDYSSFYPVIKGVPLSIIAKCFVCNSCDFELMNTEQMEDLRNLTQEKYDLLKETGMISD